MKLLAISDAADPGLWDHFTKDKLAGVDAIISCGDLPSNYLSFLVTMGNIPVFYVYGNHDTGYEKNPPEGCDCIDGEVVTFKGYRILGLGGCFRYNKGPHQYTEQGMRRRIAKVRSALRRDGVDILVTHAPAQGLGDMDDGCHRGFACFRELLDKYHPLSRNNSKGGANSEYSVLRLHFLYAKGSCLLSEKGRAPLQEYSI